MDPLYTTIAENTAGMPGTSAIIAPGGLSLPVASPLSAAPGTNPEQLLGLAFATCLNTTLRLIEARQGDPLDSRVTVNVTMGKDVAGYQFHVAATAFLPAHTPTDAAVLLAQAERECPVAKLLGDSANVTIALG